MRLSCSCQALQQKLHAAETRNEELASGMEDMSQPLLRQIDALQSQAATNAKNWQQLEISYVLLRPASLVRRVLIRIVSLDLFSNYSRPRWTEAQPLRRRGCCRSRSRSW